jgi:hypothetical protein|nr:DUF3841 domain-containing protein [Neorhizobium tomejilense]
MRLYHYMDSPAYSALMSTGSLVGSPSHSPFPEFAAAYGWLAGEMRNRIGDAPGHANGAWPVFAWAMHEGMNPVSYDHDHPEHGGDLLVGFEVPEGSYVLSDFDDWHYILNNWYLPSTGSSDDETASAESAEFDRRCEEAGYDIWMPGERGTCPDIETMRRRHWNRVVELPHLSGSVQATLWELKAEWVFFVRARTWKAIPGLEKPTRAIKRRRRTGR